MMCVIWCESHPVKLIFSASDAVWTDGSGRYPRTGTFGRAVADLCAVSADHVRGLFLLPIHITNLQAINAVGRSDVFLKLEVIKKAWTDRTDHRSPVWAISHDIDQGSVGFFQYLCQCMAE